MCKPTVHKYENSWQHHLWAGLLLCKPSQFLLAQQEELLLKRRLLQLQKSLRICMVFTIGEEVVQSIGMPTEGQSHPILKLNVTSTQCISFSLQVALRRSMLTIQPCCNDSESMSWHIHLEASNNSVNPSSIYIQFSQLCLGNYHFFKRKMNSHVIIAYPILGIQEIYDRVS